MEYEENVLTCSYWEGNGKFQNEYDEFFDSLIPDSGKSDTLEGEMLRAISRLYYDYYSNGMCNDTSSSINFLMYLNSEAGVINLNHSYLKKIATAAQGIGYTSQDLEEELEDTLNRIVEHIISKRDDLTPNWVDSLTFSRR